MKKYNTNKKSDKLRWIITGVAFIMVFIMLIGVCMQVFGNDKVKPSNWFKKTEQTAPSVSEAENHFIATPENNPKSVMKLNIASTLVAPDSISQYAAESYTVTATVAPSNATLKDVAWTLSFKNASSSWANGKSVTDYVTLTSTTSSATVTCKQAFGEQIIITGTSVGTPSVSATCTLDYLKRVESATATLRVGSNGVGLLGDDNDIIKNYTLGVGTVEGTFTWNETADFVLTSEVYEAIQSHRLYSTFIDYMEIINNGKFSEMDSQCTINVSDGTFSTYIDDICKSTDGSRVKFIDGSYDAESYFYSILYDVFSTHSPDFEFSYGYSYTYGSKSYQNGVSSTYEAYHAEFYTPASSLSLSNSGFVFVN